jgi:N-acetyltransferase
VEENIADVQQIWQPFLEGENILAVPLQESHFNSLFDAAADPRIWEMHPIPNRHTLPEFEIYFRSGIESRGALVFLNRHSGEVIGSSRYAFHKPELSRVEIGWTFLRRSYWGSGANKEVKFLMLKYAFQFVSTVEFLVGVDNLRSQAAVLKIGGNFVGEVERFGRKSFVYEISKNLYENELLQNHKNSSS